MRYLSITGLLGVLLAGITLAACDNEIPNPNASTLAEASQDQDGLIAMANGLSVGYAAVLERVLLTPGTTARELEITNTFVNLLELGEGGEALTDNNGNIISLWGRAYRVIGAADVIIENAPTAIQDASILSGVLGAAHFYKAATLSYLIESFESVPINTSADGAAEFRSRAEVLAEAIRLLSEASTLLGASPPSTSVVSSLGNDFDLPNMINAYRARVNLQAGNFAEALNAANQVDLTSVSYFTFNSENQNPVYLNASLETDLNYSPIDNFGIEGVNPADGRLEFYLEPLDSIGRFGYNFSLLKGFYDELDKNIPVYLPGEIILIKAEALARQDQINEAIAELNKVLTKTNDPTGVNAALPAYSGPATQEAVLNEILKNRNIELFLTGLRLGDSKRFGQPGPPATDVFRNRNFYPYPDTERANNPNVPENPAI
ncbi:MAG: RagB/SusD family nutrient uptake outer membrane protein [Tunicatimonas sp.]